MRKLKSKNPRAATSRQPGILELWPGAYLLGFARKQHSGKDFWVMPSPEVSFFLSKAGEIHHISMCSIAKDSGRESLFPQFPDTQPCKVAPIVANSWYRWSPADDIFLMKTKRCFCLSTSPTIGNQTSSPSWLKKLLTQLKGKHRSKSEDNAGSSKSRKGMILKQDGLLS